MSELLPQGLLEFGLHLSKWLIDQLLHVLQILHTSSGMAGYILHLGDDGVDECLELTVLLHGPFVRLPVNLTDHHAELMVSRAVSEQVGPLGTLVYHLDLAADLYVSRQLLL